MNSNGTLISVIVPVYQAELYLDRCVNSIIQQTYPYWELLLIDDGSLDNSPAMCDAWAFKDNRIKTFHKENGGVSSARNLGIDNIRGQWLTFVDADDCVEPTCFEECIRHAENNDLDVLQFRMKRFFSNGRINFNEAESSPICNTETYVKCKYLSGCIWGGIYRSQIILENHIRFNENLHYLEDAFVVCSILSFSKRNQRWNKHFYLYFYNPEGSDKPKNWDYYLDSIEYAAEYKKSNPLFGKLIDGWCTMLAMRYVTLAHKHNYNRFKKAWDSLSVNKDHLHQAGRKDVVFFETVYHLFGTRASFVLTKLISKIYYMVNHQKQLRK